MLAVHVASMHVVFSRPLKHAYERDGSSSFQTSSLVTSEEPAEGSRKTRRGEWPHRRVVGKQFPPLETRSRIRGVRSEEPGFVK